jgi:Domain of unknown function (DUF1735)
MKLTFLISIGVLFCSALASCLKDTPFMDVSNTAPIIEFGQSPAQGLQGPFVYGYDTYGVYGPPNTFVASDTLTLTDTAIALVLASPQVEASTLQTVVGIDTAQISAFNTANSTNFTLLPDSLYTLSDTVNISAGYRVGRIPVVLKFPGLHNYALPIKIVNSYFMNNKTGVVISGNSGTFMWLFE